MLTWCHGALVHRFSCMHTKQCCLLKRGLFNHFTHALSSVNPFTLKSDQSPISPVASPEILHHTVWRTWLFIAYSNERLLHYQFSLPHPYISLEEGWENVLFELPSSKSAFSQPFKDKFISEVVRIASIIIFHLSKLWRARFSILCDGILLVRLQEKFEFDHSWDDAKFPMQAHQKSYITQYGEPGFSSLPRWKIILPNLTTSRIHAHFSFKGCQWGEITLWTWEWKGSTFSWDDTITSLYNQPVD